MLGSPEEPGYAWRVSTDPGLGPKSSRTDPGVGGKPPEAPSSVHVEPPPRPLQSDSVEAVLDGFGKDRPDRARVKPLKESTPLPPEVKPSQKGISTSPGQRQRSTQKRALYILITAACLLLVVGLAWFAKPGAGGDGAATATATATAPVTATVTATATATATATSVEALPTAPVVTATAKPTMTAKSSAGPALTTPPPPVPTGTASAATSSGPTGPDPKNDVKRTM